MRLSPIAGLAGLLLAACATEVKAPTADAGQPARVPPNFAVSLDGSKSSDPQGLPLSYSWSFRSVPAGSTAVFVDPHRVSATFTADVAGTYDVELVVDNGVKQSRPATVSVTADASVGVVLPISGFTVASVYAGAKDFMTRPRGIAVGTSGVLYVAQSAGGGGGGTARVTRHAGGVSSILAQGGYLSNAEGVACDAAGGRLLVATGGRRIVAVTQAGVQSPFAEPPGQHFGIAVVRQANATDRIYVGDDNTDTVLTFDTTGATGAPLFNGAPTAGSGWGVRGVGGVVSGGVDVAFGAYVGSNSIYRQSGATITRLATHPLLDTPADVVVTPCGATSKIIAASNATGTISVLDDCATADCGTATFRQLLTGLANPVGLAFESPSTLYVTDETLGAVFKVDGPFCSL